MLNVFATYLLFDLIEFLALLDTSGHVELIFEWHLKNLTSARQALLVKIDNFFLPCSHLVDVEPEDIALVLTESVEEQVVCCEFCQLIVSVNNSSLVFALCYVDLWSYHFEFFLKDRPVKAERRADFDDLPSNHIVFLFVFFSFFHSKLYELFLFCIA